jgi:Na+/H+ antiporter NhaA
MPLQLRKNPKTTGWQRRIAIAILAGLGAFCLSLPISFYLFLSHFNTVSPTDTQNLLSALGASVVVGVGLALIALTATLLATVFYGRLRPTPSA